jgi:hypothetical protein
MDEFNCNFNAPMFVDFEREDFDSNPESYFGLFFFKFFTYSRPYIWIQYPRLILDSLIKILPNSFITFCHISSQFRHTISLLIMYYNLKLSIFTNILSHLINSYISFITVQQLLVTLLLTHWHITYFYHTLICYTL